MPLLFRMVQVLDWIIALSWTARVLVWRRMLPLVPNLGHAGYPHAGRLPSMTVIVLRSMLLAIWRGGIVWRGTFYSLHDLRRRAGK
jgi:hypothetical protein